MNQVVDEEIRDRVPADEAKAEKLDEKGKKGKRAKRERRGKSGFLSGKAVKIGAGLAALSFQLFAAYMLMSYVFIPHFQGRGAELLGEGNENQATDATPNSAMAEAGISPQLQSTLDADSTEFPLTPGLPSMDPNCVVKYDDIIINPAYSSGERFLVISLVVVTDTETAARELRFKEPIVKDFFISWLSKRGILWYSNFENHEILRDEFKSQISALLATGSLTHVFFTKYIIQ